MRTRPARDAIKFTVNVEALLKASEEGNNKELLKVLSNQESKKGTNKRKAEPTVEEGEKKAKPEEKESDEEEMPEFECENCSG